MDGIEPLISWPKACLAVMTGVLMTQAVLLRRLRQLACAVVAAKTSSFAQSSSHEATGGAATGNSEPGESPSVATADRRAGSSDDKPTRRLRFVMDSLFLIDSYRFVCAQKEEAFHYVTGVRCGEREYALLHIVRVEYAEQSVSSVRVADASNISVLARLDEWGLPLLAHVHSHPAVGPGGTKPSATDRQLTKRLAQGGHIAIGLLFSRDGFVRFYADESLSFDVEIQGNHVRKVEEKVYAIDIDVADSDVPLMEDSAAVPKRSGGGGAPGSSSGI